MIFTLEPTRTPACSSDNPPPPSIFDKNRPLLERSSLSPTPEQKKKKKKQLGETLTATRKDRYRILRYFFPLSGWGNSAFYCANHRVSCKCHQPPGWHKFFRWKMPFAVFRSGSGISEKSEMLAWPPLQSPAVKENFFLCKFLGSEKLFKFGEKWAVKIFSRPERG